MTRRLVIGWNGGSFRFLAPALAGLLFLVPACGGGGSGPGGGSSPPAGEGFRVGQRTAAPGAFITIEDRSIIQGETLDVTFRNDRGFEVVVPSNPAADGQASVAVPPYIDGVAQGISSGTMTVSISNAKQATVEIEPLPDLQGLDAGFVLKTYLDVQLENLNTLLLNLDAFATDYGYDVAGLRRSLQKRADDIDTALLQLNGSGTIVGYAPYSGSSGLSQEELKQLDQVLYAMARGVAAASGVQTARSFHRPGGPVAADQLTDLRAQIRRTVEAAQRMGDVLSPAAWAETVRQNSRRMMSNLTWLQALIKSRTGALGDSTINPWLRTAQESLRLLVVEGFQHLANLLTFAREGRSDDLINGLLRALPDLYDLLAPASVKEIESDIREIVNTSAWVYTHFCKLGLLERGEFFGAYCEEAGKTAGLLSPSTVVITHVSPPVIESGEQATLRFSVGGDRPGTDHAEQNDLSFDWGDSSLGFQSWNDFSGSREGGAFGSGEETHVYASPVDKTYTIKVSVAGDNAPDHRATATATIQVKAAIEPLRVSVVGPTSLDVGEPGVWRAVATGGAGPFRGSIRWGDGGSAGGESRSGRVKAQHAYTAQDFYTLVVELTDSRGQSATAQGSVKVGALEWQAEETCGDGLDNTGDGQIDEGCPVYPNWDGGCDRDNSNNSGGATALWYFGDPVPYVGRGLVCSDRDGLLWMSHTHVDSGAYLLVTDVAMGASDPSSPGCFTQPQVTLDTGAVIGGGWICPL